METKEAYKKMLKAHLKEWNVQINLFAAKAEKAGADAKLKYAKDLDALYKKQREAAKKLKELEESSGEAWKEIKVTADKLWDDLKTGVANAASKFK